MNVSLTPQLEQLVREKVESGRYNNASEVVREGLRLIERRDQKLNSLRILLQEGFDQIERGEYVDADEDYFDRVDREIEEEFRQEQAPKKAEHAQTTS
jgi:antitoxin ParD1/3/4